MRARDSEADDCSPLAYAGGQALLDRLRGVPHDPVLGVDLAVALGILLAEQCDQEDLRLPIALAHAVAVAAAHHRRKAMIVSSCAGTA